VVALVGTFRDIVEQRQPRFDRVAADPFVGVAFGEVVECGEGVG